MSYRVLLLALLFPFCALAQTADVALSARSSRVIDDVILPAYRDVGAKAEVHRKAWHDFCAGRGKIAAVQQSHGALADSWHRIEFLHYGPISTDFRLERVHFWPDRRNATARGLMELLDASSPMPDLERVKAQSAAVQGLPVLERLIYAVPPDQKPLAKADARICRLADSISLNLVAMMAETTRDWQALKQKSAADPALVQEIVTRVTTDAVAQYQTLVDTKLLPALGRTPDAARPALMESARAKRSRAPFEQALIGQIAIIKALGGEDEETISLLKRLHSALAVVRLLPEDLGPMLATPKGWSSGLLLKDALKGVEDAVAAQLPALAGVTIGFNSNDGD